MQPFYCLVKMVSPAVWRLLSVRFICSSILINEDGDDDSDLALDSLLKQSVGHNHPNLFAPHQDPGFTLAKSR